MNNESIFSCLKHYAPSEGSDPKEDYFTQMIAWMLENMPGLAHAYVDLLCGKLHIQLNHSTEKISVDTQRVIDIDDGIGRIDLLIRVGSSIGFVCEHKVNSELSENQIAKYMAHTDQLGNGRFYSVLVTLNAQQHKQEANVCLVWSDIYSFILARQEEYKDIYTSPVEEFLIGEFLRYMKENGMGPYEEIRPDMIYSWFEAQKLGRSLNTLFSELANEDWMKNCPALDRVRQKNDSFAPRFSHQWGRVGINFFSEWRPGVFAGVLLDTYDHKLEPLHEEKGPDFVVFLESDYAKRSKKKEDKHNLETYRQITNSVLVRDCKERLANNSEGFDFLPGLELSPWRVVVLRKSLFDILNLVYKKEDQKSALRSEIIRGINLILGQ